MYGSTWGMEELKVKVDGSHKEAGLSKPFDLCLLKAAQLRSAMTGAREGARCCVRGQIIAFLRSLPIKELTVFNEEPFKNKSSAPWHLFQVNETFHTFSKVMHLLK